MDEDMLAKLIEYTTRRGSTIVDYNLGSGIHGVVVLCEDDAKPGFTVLKMHFARGSYLRERDAYLHLRDLGWREVCGCVIPPLLAWDDDELALELQFVSPPYCLDFGQAYLYIAPEFPEGVCEATYEKWREQFGRDWPKVQEILNEFESIDLHYLDPNPDNMRFR